MKGRDHPMENRRFGISMEPADLARVGEIIEVCREHASNVAGLARTTAAVLCECYTYESTEPHLGYGCRLVCDVLEQVVRALEPLSIAVPCRDPLHLAAACDLQRRQLLGVQGVIRAMEFVSRSTFDCRRSQEREMRDVLREMDEGVQTLSAHWTRRRWAYPQPTRPGC